jgi:hypothetical protein
MTKLNWQESSRKNENCHIKFDISDIDTKNKNNCLYNHYPDNR